LNLIAQPVLEARAALGEGPLWDSQESVLHWVDINNSCVHSFDPQSGKDTFTDVGAKVGCIVKRYDRGGGGFIVSLPETFAHLAQGQVTPVATVEQGLGNRMNDGKCDPAGRFWCGSMHPDFNAGAGNLWMMDIDLSVEKKIEGVSISNGLAWNAGATTMYYIDTPTGQVDAFDYDIASGAISNRRLAFKNSWGGYFDGMTIDADDNLYIAIWGGGCVLKINPGSGELLAKITVPGVKNVTSCTFGGVALNELYITSSGEGADPKKEPNAGALFHISLPDCQGLPASEFLG
jgi:sugar lactone lactonase YvrE